MQTILAWCREQRCDQVTLGPSEEGRALYESLGFVAANEMKLT
jgi:hypothetical protein